MIHRARILAGAFSAALGLLLLTSAPHAAPASWGRVEHDALRGGGHVVYVMDVLPAESGNPWLAVGYVVDGDGNRDPSAWTSNDGATWLRFEMEETGSPERRDGPFRVARLGNVSVALGNRFDGRRRPAAWWSTAPNEWNALENPADPLLAFEGDIEGVDAGPDGFVAVGYRDETSGTTVSVFRSDDGQAWRVDSSFFTPSSARFHPLGVTTTGTRVVVVGDTAGGASRDGGIWIGENGSWRSIDPAPVGLGGPGFQQVIGIAWDPNLGLVAGGLAGQSVDAPTLWVSRTGDDWERLPALEGGIAGVHEVETVPGGYVASGSSDAGPRIWRSSNGRDWSLVPTPASGSTAGKGVFVASDGTRIVFVVTGQTGSQMFHRVGADWRRADTGPAFPASTPFAAELRDVAVAKNRLVAIGNDGHERPLIMVSAAGGAWSKASFTDAAARLQAVTSDRGVFTIVGWRLIRGRARLALWTSRDGSAWGRLGGTAAVPVGAFVDITPSRWGLLAVALEGSQRGLQTSVWARSRGSWRSVAILGLGEARAICAGPNGAVAVANVGGDARSRVLAWSRPPGGSWPSEQEVVAAGSAARCADGPSGTVIVGSDASGAAVTWRRTRPGRPWIKTVVGVSAPPTAINDITRDGSGFLATGTSGGRGQSDLAIWQSADGARWARIGETEPVFLEPGFQAGQGIVKARGRIFVVGRHGAGNAGLWAGTP
jgi:hypothetical protein